MSRRPIISTTSGPSDGVAGGSSEVAMPGGEAGPMNRGAQPSNGDAPAGHRVHPSGGGPKAGNGHTGTVDTAAHPPDVEAAADVGMAADARLAGLSPEKRALLERKIKALRDAKKGRRVGPSGIDAIPRRPDRRTAPLAFPQELMWLLNHVMPNTYVYGVPRSMRLVGDLDVEVLRRALDTIVERHEILRTTYELIDGVPTQIIHDHRPFELPLVDFSGLPERERERLVESAFLRDFEKGFDLTRDLLLRATLLRLGEREHVLIMSSHHIASDGVSKQVLFRELTALYEAFRAGRASPLAELPIQYADFAHWQRSRFTGEVIEGLLGYWREKLAGAPALMDLPTDRPRPPVQTFRGGYYRRVLPPRVLDGLKALSRKERTTLFMTGLAGLAVLLRRYTGQDDLVVGTPIAGRDRPELEGLIGYFTNTLALRTDVSGDPTFRDLLARVRETCLDAFQHQDLPFEVLVTRLAPVRNQSHTPIFQVLYSLGHYAATAADLPGLQVSQVFVDRGVAKFDLSFGLTDSRDGLVVGVEYGEIFAPATIDRMVGHLQVLLEAIIADPDCRISRLPLMSEAERRRVLVGWNDTRKAREPGASIPRSFEAQARRRPEATAVVARGRSFSYRELNARANQLAHVLRRRGVGPDVPVGICTGRTPELAVAILGTLKAGGVCFPLDPDYPPDRLAYMLEDSRAPVVLTLESLVRALPAHSAELIRLDADRDAAAAEPDEDLDEGPGPDQAAYLIYTSGSTGTPMGVVLTHGGLINHALAAIDLYGLTPEDRVLQFASLSFDISVEELLPTWCAGATVVMRPDEIAVPGPELSRWLERERISVVDLPTAFWQEWAYEVRARREPPPATLRLVIVGGERATAGARAAWLEAGCGRIRWVNTYGPTEATVIATAYEPPAGAEAADEADPPIGRPIDNVQIYILDRVLQPVPIGVPGEIYIGGVGLARGYLNRPALTAERFIAHPFSDRPGARLYRTGDRARWRADGLIEFLGRADDQVKIRGFRVEPGEVEAALSRHPGVRQAAVIARGDHAGRTALAAYVVPAGEPAPSAAELRRHLGRLLPEYMIPPSFVALPTLPLTPSGKVDRRALPAPHPDSPVAREPAQSSDLYTLQMLMIWEDVLDRGSIGVDDNFFDLGGHSLLAAKVAARVKQVFGVHLPLQAFFQSPTVRGLVEVLRHDGPDQAWPTVIPVRVPRETSRIPLFCVVTPNGNPLGYSFLARRLPADQPLCVLQSPFRVEGDVAYQPWEIEGLAASYIEAVRQVQPEGPYALVGFCEGAHVAFEMARQFEARGQRIALLAILDAWTAENTIRYYPFLIQTYFRSILRAIRRRRIPSFRKGIGIYFHLLFGNTGIHRKILNAAAVPAKSPIDGLRSHLMRYWPGPGFKPPVIDGKITVFRVRRQPFWRISDPLLGWGSRSRGGVEVVEISGVHRTVLREPHVQAIAEFIGERLKPGAIVSEPAELRDTLLEDNVERPVWSSPQGSGSAWEASPAAVIADRSSE